MKISIWTIPFVFLTTQLSFSMAGKFKCPAYTRLTDNEILFPDEEQCDKYWTCKKGESRRNICPDGLVFHPEKPAGEEPCDLKHNVPDKCKGREKMQRAKPGDGRCPRQNGVYPSADAFECDTYYSCLNGKSSPTKCALGLHYSDEIGTCVWANQSGRDDCVSGDEASEGRRKKKKNDGGDTTKKSDNKKKTAKKLDNGFECPGGPLGVHPALPHPDSCQLYYVCLDGATPSDASCGKGKVFNPRTQQCDRPDNVEGCEDYYNPAARKKKTELASSLGTDIDSSEFSKFIKLLKMSGVLKKNSISNTVSVDRPLSGRLLGGRRNKKPRRPLRPVKPKFDYYDYDYDYDYDYELPIEKEVPRKFSGRPRPNKIQNSINRRPTIGQLQRVEQTSTPASLTEKKPNKPPPLTRNRQSLFSRRPDQRANRFTSKFIPRVKPVGNLENINPSGLRTDTIIQPTKLDRAPVTTTPAPVNLSGQEADKLFSSLFPTIVEENSDTQPESLPNAQPLIVEQSKERETKRIAVTSSKRPQPAALSRTRASLFRRPSTGFLSKKKATVKIATTEEPVIMTQQQVVIDQEPVIVTEAADLSTIKTNTGRHNLFSIRNNLRSRHRFTSSRKTKQEKETDTEIPVPNVESNITPSTLSEQSIGSDKEEKDDTQKSSFKPNALSRKNSFLNRLRSRLTTKLPEISTSQVTIVTTPPAPSTDQPAFLSQPSQVNNPTFTQTSPIQSQQTRPRLRKPVLQSASGQSVFGPISRQPIKETNSNIDLTPAVQETISTIPVQQTIIRQTVQRQPEEEVFTQTLQRQPFLRQPEEETFTTTSSQQPFQRPPDQQILPFDLSPIRQPLQASRQPIQSSRQPLQSPRQEDISPRQQVAQSDSRQSAPRSSPRSLSISDKDYLDEGEKQRIVAIKARKRLRKFLPKAQNEGEAIEILREQLRRLPNKNRARGRK